VGDAEYLWNCFRAQTQPLLATTSLVLALLCSILWTTGCGLTINNVRRSYVVSVTALDQNHMTETTVFTLHVTQPGMTPWIMSFCTLASAPWSAWKKSQFSQGSQNSELIVRQELTICWNTPS
jgi:hypothetical protein